MNENPATDVDRAALELVKKLGMTAKEVSLPNWPYGSLMHGALQRGGGRVRGADAQQRRRRR